eukprot:5108053-Lingulodinium_polyedra.AAC.1
MDRCVRPVQERTTQAGWRHGHFAEAGKVVEAVRAKLPAPAHGGAAPRVAWQLGASPQGGGR